MEMATLKELLVDDGFKRGREKQKPLQRQSPTESSAASFPHTRLGSSVSKPRPARTKSDVNPRRSLSLMPEKGGCSEPRPGNALMRRLSSLNFYKEQSPDVQETKGKFFRHSKNSKESEGRFTKNQWHLFTIDEPDVNCKSRRVIGSKDGYSEYLHRKLGYIRCYKNELYEDEERKVKITQNIQVKPSFEDVRDEFPVPALDETASNEVILLINSYISQLLKDEGFRSSVNQRCISSLNSSAVKDRQPNYYGVLYTLKEAIGAVERIITEGFNVLELKKTSLKLSIITDLKLMESDDRYYPGISKSHLAACAHLYLSILYMIQKKDKVSAKHLLQVFFDSPYHSRTTLLPELWEHLFLPHLSHLKAWYDREVVSIQGTSGMMRKLEFLNKLYNDLLDMGTSKFAAYYKGWLMEENKDPTLLSILIPFASFPEMPEDDYEIISTEPSSLSDSVPSKAMISKTLYESTLAQSKRIQRDDGMESGEEEKDETEDEIEEGQSDVWRQCNATMQKDEAARNQSPYLGSYSTEIYQEYYSANSPDLDASFEENGQTNDKSCGSSSSSFSEADEINRSSEMVPSWQDSKEHIHVNRCDLQDKENELKMKKLSQAAFQLQVTDHYKDVNTNSNMQSISLPVYNSYQDEMMDTHKICDG